MILNFMRALGTTLCQKKKKVRWAFTLSSLTDDVSQSFLPIWVGSFMPSQFSEFTASIKQIVLAVVASWGICQLGAGTMEPQQATGTAILFTYSFIEPFKKLLSRQLPVCLS